jgi:hypothetical protein
MLYAREVLSSTGALLPDLLTLDQNETTKIPFTVYR